MLSEAKCAKSFSNNFSKSYEVFLLEPLYIVHRFLKYVLLENKALQLDIYCLKATWTSNSRVYSFHSNTKFHAKYSNAIFGDQFIDNRCLKYLRNWVGCEFWEFAFQTSSMTHFKHEIPIWALVRKNLLSPVSKQNRHTWAVSHFINRLSVPLNL